jgi:hypothetical protein
MTGSQQAAFTNAAARWATLVVNDLADLSVSIASNSCGASPALNETIDDVLIFASINVIDGPSGILGSASPCFIRTAGGLPLIGQMRFDIADVPALEASNSFGSVVLHEMGHVLGIGTLWPTSMLQNPSTPGLPPLDTFFNGVNAIAGFNAIGGNTYTGGQKVPVENLFSAGTINAHCRESVLQNELMTGFLNAGSNPLSVLTVRSLQDLGYVVNTAPADAFSLTLALRSGVPAKLFSLENDVLVGPLYTVDQSGRVTRIR